MSSQIKQRLNKKIVELSNDFIGGRILDFALYIPGLSNEYIKEQIINEIKLNKNNIIKSIINSLHTVLTDIKNSELGWIQRILKAPTTNTDYKSWLNKQIENWINKNNEEIFIQILTYIKKFIDDPPTNVPVTTKAPPIELPPLLKRYPAETHPRTHFLLRQAPPGIEEALKTYRSRSR